MKWRKTITKFTEMNLSPEMMRGLTKMGFETPSPVQEKAIEPMMEGRDLLVQAPTGTGKTAAFGIPTVESTDSRGKNIQTVVLCPTRELAVQTATVLKQLVMYKPGVRILALYGGEYIGRQITALKRRPQIIVATPGRFMDHMNRRTIRLGHVNRIVLDEADRMLDMGFRDDIAEILKAVPEERQTVLFSATMPEEVKKIASAYQRDVQTIRVKQDKVEVRKIEQRYLEIRKNMKLPELQALLKEKQWKRSIVFVGTKSMADTLSEQLTEAGYPANALHGDLRQSQRDTVMRSYRSGRTKILVATDVAARGIDVDGIDAVINFDIPQDCDSYTHRIGRTGRAGQSGLAYTFIYPRERQMLQKIMTVTKETILPAKPGVKPLYSDAPDRKRQNRGRNGNGKPYNKMPPKPRKKNYGRVVTRNDHAFSQISA